MIAWFTRNGVAANLTMLLMVTTLLSTMMFMIVIAVWICVHMCLWISLLNRKNCASCLYDIMIKTYDIMPFAVRNFYGQQKIHRYPGIFSNSFS